MARRFPIRMLESGPAAGALMSSRHGAALGLPQLLSFDMGGTTAKGCIVQNARPLKHYHMEVARLHEFKRGSGLPVRIPVIDMIEIGAGGGSLTLFDAIRKHGGKPANYCEIGGNPSVSKASELTKLVLSKPGVEKIAVMMNVVSNTRVDIMARGIIKGVVESGFDPKEKITIFRIPGSWEEEGFKILEKYGVEYCDRSVSMDEAARRAVAKIEGV